MTNHEVKPLLCMDVYDLTKWDSDELKYLNGYPVYTVNFLLNQLAYASHTYNIALFYSVVEKIWRCGYKGHGSMVYADEAGDAVAKLIIRTFKKKKAVV